MCPTTKPCEPPEKRPSVIKATLSPKPAPIMAEVGFSISGIPGPPLGPQYRMTTTSPGFIIPFSRPGITSNSLSKTTAVPSKYSPSLPLILATQPSEARFPYNI